VTVRVTEKLPLLAKVWTGLLPVVVLPLPKFQLRV